MQSAAAKPASPDDDAIVAALKATLDKQEKDEELKVVRTAPFLNSSHPPPPHPFTPNSNDTQMKLPLPVSNHNCQETQRRKQAGAKILEEFHSPHLAAAPNAASTVETPSAVSAAAPLTEQDTEAALRKCAPLFHSFTSPLNRRHQPQTPFITN